MPAASAVRNHLVTLHSRGLRYVMGDIHPVAHDGDSTHTWPHLYRPPSAEDGYKAAIEVLKSYNCWDQVSRLRTFLLAADPAVCAPGSGREEGHASYYEFRVMGPES